MLISVIVPFRNAACFLPALLCALEAQQLPREDFEVILVDNLSTDGGPALIAATAPAFRHRLLSYDARGSSYGARNVGVRAASGRILAFTDADCRPEPQWLLEIRRHFDAPDAAGSVLSGDVAFFFQDPASPWEHFDRNVHMQNAARAGRHEVATANMAVLKTDFYRVGEFEEVLSGADYAWSVLAAQAGLRVRFLADVRVLHPTRGDYEEMRRKLERIAYGQGELSRQRRQSLVRESLRYLVRALLPKNSLLPALSVRAELGLRPAAILFFGLLRIRFRQLQAFRRGYAGC